MYGAAGVVAAAVRRGRRVEGSVCAAARGLLRQVRHHADSAADCVSLPPCSGRCCSSCG